MRGYLNESHDCSSLTVPLPIPVVFEMVPIERLDLPAGFTASNAVSWTPRRVATPPVARPKETLEAPTTNSLRTNVARPSGPRMVG